MSLQVPCVLLPHGRGVLLHSPAAPQAGAVRNEGSDQDVEGPWRGYSGSQKIQRQSAGYDCHRVGERSVCDHVSQELCLVTSFSECCQVS